MVNSRIFAGTEYLDALAEHYPDVGNDAPNLFGFVGDWTRRRDILAKDDERFVQPDAHPFTAAFNVWHVCAKGDIRWISARTTYKGLIHGKTAFDLVLYSNLIWELQPKTILEFGALQGGSALWFVDQLQTLCESGEVHSFEILTKCIHPRAQHQNLYFHHADLRDTRTLDKALLERLPHPWLVVEDAHCNLEEVIPFVSSLMQAGDYYVIEDVYMGADQYTASNAVAMMKRCGFLVDMKFTDAFGQNVTCSPNAWLIKT
jgi:cephalosporin hydroxylase